MKKENKLVYFSTIIQIVFNPSFFQKKEGNWKWLVI